MLRNVHAIAARLVTATAQYAAVLEDVLSTPTMRENVIRLSRRRRPRVHIIEQNIARRTVRDASSFPGCEHSRAPVPVLTRASPGGHHERHPLAANSNGPPLTRKATLEIYTVAPDSSPPPPGWFQTPPGTEHPPGCLQAPPGAVSRHPPGTNHPRVRVRHYPGVARCQDARPTMSATR